MKKIMILVGLTLVFFGYHPRWAYAQCAPAASALNNVSVCPESNPAFCLGLTNVTLIPVIEDNGQYCRFKVNNANVGDFVKGPIDNNLLFLIGNSTIEAQQATIQFSGDINDLDENQPTIISITYKDTDAYLSNANLDKMQLETVGTNNAVQHTLYFPEGVTVGPVEDNSSQASQQSQQDKDRAKALKNAAIKQKLDAIKKMKKYKWK